MTTWPGTFPFIEDPNSYSESGPQGNVIRSPMEKGTTKSRRRFTYAPRVIKGRTSIMTDAQVDLFMTFFRDVLGDGVLTFDAPHPRTGVTTTFKFMSSYDVVFVHEDMNRIAMELEVQ